MLCLVSAAVTCRLIHDKEGQVFRGPIAQKSVGVSFYCEPPWAIPMLRLRPPGIRNNTKNTGQTSNVYWTVHYCDSWRIKTNLISLDILFHFLCAQCVSDINISIIRSLRLFCWITTLVVLLLVRCVLEFRCGSFGVVSVFQAETSACNTDTTPNQPHRNANTHRTNNNTTNVVIQQNSRKLLMMDILISETHWAHKKWNKISNDIKLVFHSSTVKTIRNTVNTSTHVTKTPTHYKTR